MAGLSSMRTGLHSTRPGMMPGQGIGEMQTGKYPRRPGMPGMQPGQPGMPGQPEIQRIPPPPGMPGQRPFPKGPGGIQRIPPPPGMPGQRGNPTDVGNGLTRWQQGSPADSARLAALEQPQEQVAPTPGIPTTPSLDIMRQGAPPQNQTSRYIGGRRGGTPPQWGNQNANRFAPTLNPADRYRGMALGGKQQLRPMRGGNQLSPLRNI